MCIHVLCIYVCICLYSYKLTLHHLHMLFTQLVFFFFFFPLFPHSVTCGGKKCVKRRKCRQCFLSNALFFFFFGCIIIKKKRSKNTVVSVLALRRTLPEHVSFCVSARCFLKDLFIFKRSFRLMCVRRSTIHFKRFLKLYFPANSRNLIYFAAACC